MTGLTLQPRTIIHQPSCGTGVLSLRQPVFRVVMMLALLTGLAGGASVGMGHSGENPSAVAAGLMAQATPTEALFTCLSYGPSAKTDQQLAQMSMSDWPSRHYTPVAPADPVIAADAVVLYQAWYECAWYLAEAFSDSSFHMSAEAQRWIDTVFSYTSDRYQYVSFLGNFPERSPSDLEAAHAFSQDELIQDGPLPLNRPMITVTIPETGTMGITYPSFAPGDVYALTDGRYGAFIGSISTEQLQAYASGEPVSSSSPLAVGEWLTWIAFVEADGHLLIDEYVSFCVSPPLETNGTPEVAGNYQYDGALPGTIGNCQSVLGG